MTTPFGSRIGEARLAPQAPQSISVSTQAVQITSDKKKGAVYIFNYGSGDIFIGTTSGVTTSNGIPIPTKTGLWLLFDRVVWYAIAGSAQDVRVTEWI